MAQHPRPSILSLFDPLSLSSTSDKENNSGETSFFHPPGFSQSPVAQHTLRRRLIDIGEMTVDEPDMRHLLEMEDELEELNKHIAEDDEGDTLTWRDMAKAATPKWSGCHASSFTTPQTSPTPRTPLAEISFQDETTPMARKKSYKRQIVSGPSKLVQADVTPESSIPAPSSPPLITSSDEASSLPVSPPSIQISNVDTDGQDKDDHTNASQSALGSSVCTLSLPTPTDNLLADTSLPLSVSSSSQSSLSPSTVMSLPHAQARLRPDSHSKASADNRLSVDLQSSFQLHLNTSDTSFDLLNEKISFFSLKNGADSFLNNLGIDDSFGDDDFVVVKPNADEDKPSENPSVPIDPERTPLETTSSIPQSSTKSPRPESLRVFVPKVKSTTEIGGENVAQAIVKPSFIEINESHASPTATAHSPIASRLPSPSRPRPSIDEKEPNVLSTPHLLQYPSKSIPALKIVKRSKILSRRLSTAVNAAVDPISTTVSTSTSALGPSRRTSSISSINPPAVRAKIIPSVSSPAVNNSRSGNAPQLLAANPTKRIVPSVSNPSISGDGPRRVLVSEGPKLNSLISTRNIGHSEPIKASLAVNGPRRVVVNSVANIAEKPVSVAKPVVASQPQVSTGLRQPVKYNTIGTSSGIPKPVSRAAGSRLPAPASGSNSSKSRFGVPTIAASAPGKGLLGRRVT